MAKTDVSGVKSALGLDDVTQPRIWRMLFAELVGTFLLVLVGCTSLVRAAENAASPLEVALAFGLTLAAVALAVGHVSGAHVNPAVTAGLLVSGRISLLKALSYVAVQMAGAVAASAALHVASPSAWRGALGRTEVAQALGPGRAVFVEAVITAVLVLVVMAVTDDKRRDVRGSAPLAIGLAVAVCHIAAIPYTGSSMNPARSFGPAVVTGVWTYHWVYWAGPVAGGVVAALIYKWLLQPRKGEDDDAASYDF